MSTEKKKSLVSAIVVYFAFLLAFVFGVVYVSTNDNFSYEHRSSDIRPGYEPTPEINRYQISPSLAWEATNDGSAVIFKIAGFVILVILGVYLYALSTDRIILGKDNAAKIAFGLCIIVGAFLFAAHASTYSNNYVYLTPEQQASQEKLSIVESLFKSKELIK